MLNPNSVTWYFTSKENKFKSIRFHKFKSMIKFYQKYWGGKRSANLKWNERFNPSGGFNKQPVGGNLFFVG